MPLLHPLFLFIYGLTLETDFLRAYQLHLEYIHLILQILSQPKAQEHNQYNYVVEKKNYGRKQKSAAKIWFRVLGVSHVLTKETLSR